MKLTLNGYCILKIKHLYFEDSRNIYYIFIYLSHTCTYKSVCISGPYTTKFSHTYTHINNMTENTTQSWDAIYPSFLFSRLMLAGQFSLFATPSLEKTSPLASAVGAPEVTSTSRTKAAIPWTVITTTSTTNAATLFHSE